MTCMNAVLAFSALPAASKLQRARCARTGRFVAWARAAALRLPGAPAVVTLLPAPAVVVVVAPSPAPVVVAVVQVEAVEVVAQVAPLSSPRAREGAAQVAPSPLRAVAVAVVAQAQALVADAAALVVDAAATLAGALAGAWGRVARRWTM